ncbi:MAG: hypothetical protein C0501_27930 [Isosphaera sp.]|nr:hypothetical protein [Isosphaera sp.]
MFAVVSVMIVVGGGFGVLIGLALLVGTVRFLRVAESAAGVVVAHEAKVDETPDQDGMRTCFVYPVVEFEDRSGRHHRVTLATGTAGYQPFPVGTRVEILWPPDDPARARIRSFLHLWFFPTMFTASGLLGVAGGLLFYSWTS